MDISEKNYSNIKKIDFKKRKENALNSLIDIEHFLHDFKQIVKGIKLYKTMKW